MRSFFRNFGYKMQGFMQGRYGDDELNRVLTTAGLICVLASCIGFLRYLSIPGMILCILSLFRMFSRNVYKRQLENRRFLSITGGIKRFFTTNFKRIKESKTHSYYKCPSCKAYVRIRKPPKGKNIAVRCSKCGNEFTKRT